MKLVADILNYFSIARRLIKRGNWRNFRDVLQIAAKDRQCIAPFFSYQEDGKNTKRVLFSSFVPLPYSLKIEGLFSCLLKTHGWEGVCLYPHGDLIVKQYHKDLFGNRIINMLEYIPWFRLKKIIHRVESILESDYETIKAFEYLGSLVGINALSTLSGAETTGMTDLTTENRRKLRSLMIRSCLYTEACQKIIRELQPNLVMANEKGGVGCCEIFSQAIEHGIDFVQWLSCHEPDSIMVKRYNRENLRAHPFSISPKSWALICKKPWKEDYRTLVMEEFEQGYGENKWFKYKKLTDHTAMLSFEDIKKRWNLNPQKKLAVIFSPVLNDANLFYGKDLFIGGFREWLTETVKAAIENDKVNWVLKLHPANLFRRANFNYAGEYGEIIALRKTFGHIPQNLRIIYPDDEINPLSLFRCLDYALTVRGTIGAEIPCFGKPVLTAGTGRYSGLGFTEDSKSAQEYLNKIRNIHHINSFGEERTRLAIRHAYLFFKVRPAKYNTFAEDSHPYPQGHPFNRDIRFKAHHFSELLDNPQLKAIIDWMTTSKDEDFLAKTYDL